jgi:hypothetical protein
VGNFSKSLVRRLSGHPPRPAKPTGLPANEGQLALPDGRKLWVQRVPRTEWHLVPEGTDLLLIRTARGGEPELQAIEMATVLDNKLNHPAVPCLALAWGWCPEGESDQRPGKILRLSELHVLLRYELRQTNCSGLVATINPSVN